MQNGNNNTQRRNWQCVLTLHMSLRCSFCRTHVPECWVNFNFTGRQESGENFNFRRKRDRTDARDCLLPTPLLNVSPYITNHKVCLKLFYRVPVNRNKCPYNRSLIIRIYTTFKYAFSQNSVG